MGGVLGVEGTVEMGESKGVDRGVVSTGVCRWGLRRKEGGCKLTPGGTKGGRVVDFIGDVAVLTEGDCSILVDAREDSPYQSRCGYGECLYMTILFQDAIRQRWDPFRDATVGGEAKMIR